MRRLCHPLGLLILIVIGSLAQVATSEFTLQDAQTAIAELSKRVEKNEKLLSQEVKEPPYMSVCAAQGSAAIQPYRAVKYEKIIHFSTNLQEGGLDKCTGVFTSGQKGTYLVTWSTISGATGGGDSVALRKNRDTIRESKCTWSQQGRTLLIELNKKDTLELIYNDYNNYGIGGTTFCVSLVRASETDKAISAPNIRIEPLSADSTPDSTIVYHMTLAGDGEKPGDPNFEWANKMENFLKKNYNMSNNQQDCKRECKEPCNPTKKPTCGDPCPFDVKSLRDCGEMPFGFSRGPPPPGPSREKGNISPCFFLHFDPVDYWEPKPHKYEDEPNERTRNNIRSPSTDVPVSFDCRTTWIKGEEETDLFDEITKLAEHQDPPAEDYVVETLKYFANNKDILNKLVEEEVNWEKFQEVLVFLSRFRSKTEMIRMREVFKNLIEKKKIDKPEDNSKSPQFDEVLYMDENNLKVLIEYNYEFSYTFNKTQKDDFLTALWESRTYDLSARQSHVCIDTLGLDWRQQYHCNELVERTNASLARHTMKYGKLKNELIKTNAIIDDQNTYSLIKEHLKLYSDVEDHFKNNNPQIKNYLEMFANQQQLVEFFDKDWVANKYAILKEYLSYREDETKIRTFFYPSSQGIPVKYFPFIGPTYENPLVGLRLDFDLTPGIAPGHQVEVACRAWYRGAVHSYKEKSAVLKFKIILH